MALASIPTQRLRQGPSLSPIREEGPDISMGFAQQAQLKQVQVAVPTGCEPGQQIYCTTSEGDTLTVISPERLQPGAIVTLQYTSTSPEVPAPVNLKVAGAYAQLRTCPVSIAPPILPNSPSFFAPPIPPLRGSVVRTPRLQAKGREVRQQPQPTSTEEQLRQRRKMADEQAARTGVCLYFAGWLFLPACGLGILFWLKAASQYYCQNRRTRRRFPKQSFPAFLSFATMLAVIGVTIAFVAILLLQPMQSLSPEQPTHTTSQTYSRRFVVDIVNGASHHLKSWRLNRFKWGSVSILSERPAAASGAPSPSAFLGEARSATNALRTVTVAA